MVERINGENDLQFHKRIVLGKLVDKTVDDDYSELAELAFGEKSSSDHCRKMMYGSRYTIDLYERFFDELMEENGDEAVLGKIEMANIELRKERVKLQDVKNSFQKLIREQARHETTKEIIENTLRDVELPTLHFERVDRDTSDTEMLIGLCDLHCGAFIDNAWNKFDSDILGDLLEEYSKKIIQINSVQKSKTAVVWMNGDLVSGHIHQSIVNKEDLVRQIIVVSELLSQFLTSIAGEFEYIRVCSVPGNHSRVVANKKSAILDDKCDLLIDHYLKARMQNFNWIDFDGYTKLDSTVYLLESKSHIFAGVHGDVDSTNKILDLEKFCGTPLYGVLAGHKHTNKIANIQNVRLFQSGSMQGVDNFCIEKRIYGFPEQLILICSKEDGVFCSYGVQLGKRK